MTLRHMKIFISVYKHKSVTKAAESLNMTQPAVSRAIQEIEGYYGVRLFERINRRLSVTELGKRFYERVLQITESFDIMEKELRNWDNIGILRVGASITIGSFLLPDIASKFSRDFSGVELYAVVSNGKTLEKKLLENELDVALIEGGVNEERLYAEPFRSDRLVLVLPPDSPLLEKKALCLKDIAKEKFLLREKGSVGRQMLDGVFEARGLPLKPIWESVSTGSIIRAVSKGIGVSALPIQLVQEALDSGLVATKEIADVDLTRTNYIVRHRDKHLTAAAEGFLKLCREEKREKNENSE